MKLALCSGLVCARQCVWYPCLSCFIWLSQKPSLPCFPDKDIEVREDNTQMLRIDSSFKLRSTDSKVAPSTMLPSFLSAFGSSHWFLPKGKQYSAHLPEATSKTEEWDLHRIYPNTLIHNSYDRDVTGDTQPSVEVKLTLEICCCCFFFFFF